MSPRTKSILLIVATLLIGLVLGALLNARLAERRMERLASLRSERGFVRFLEEVVQPRDEAQREAMRDVLRQTGERMAEHQERTRREAMAILDSSRQQLAEILTPEQMQRLDERLQDRRRHRRDGDFRGGDGPREFRRRPPPDTTAN